MTTTPTQQPAPDHGEPWQLTTDFARQLERELNDARAELAHWKANHDNQVKIKSTLIERPDLEDRASKIQKLIEENAAMREAIMEAHDLIKDCSARASDTTITMHPDDHAKGCIDDIWEWSDAALAKLQPFLKP